MEASSPLAAMQPPSFVLGWHGCPSDLPTSYPSFPSNRSFGPNGLNFKDVSMKKSQPDYFSMQPVRGSSPTASLAADISQNFHIDQSPQLPTPRRSLFPSSLFGTLHARESMATPPLPSSSPGPASDSMDLSPLPHKVPFQVKSSELSSPTPDVPPNVPHRLEALMEMSPEQRLPAPLPERRKQPLFRRPSLSRAKGHSTNSLPTDAKGLPSFRSGHDSSSLSGSMSLAEAFEASPPQEKTLPRPFMPVGPPRPRSNVAGAAGSCRGNGSPSANHIRKNSNSAARPRKQFRRSLSMFEHPNEVMKQEKDSFPLGGTLSSIMDFEPAHVLQLPHFVPEDQPDSLPRLTQETFIDVLDGKYKHIYDEPQIIDCRFEYEFEGGHITNAVNFTDKEQLADKLFDQTTASPKTLLIFHCEYSAHRAPIMAKFIRQKDRSVNVDQYPKLTYPEMYILDGGYSSFFNNHSSRCDPQNYVEMDAKEHEQACERGLGRVKRRTKLLRAQTFAFGQNSVQDSPTARGGEVSDCSMMDIDSDPNQSSDSGRFRATRMASY